MFDLNHYVPILKTKAGEMWALMHMESKWRAQMTPLFEVHKHKVKKDTKPKPLDLHVGGVCESILKCWGTSDPFFLDTEWINRDYGMNEALTVALNACRNLGLKAIPVIKIGYDDTALSAVKSAVAMDGRGCMLRLDFEDAGARTAVGAMFNRLGMELTDAHLMLDYREHTMKLIEDVHRLPALGEWKTFTASSAAFPKTISTMPPKTWIDVPRHDWNAWEQSTAHGDLPRNAIFSDYATRCAGPPANGGDPIVHLRYTKDRKWLVYRDGTVHSGDAPRMKLICRKLIARRDYDRPDFSEGDREISIIAHQDEKMGNPRQWVQWCVSHHLTFVTQQLQSLAAI